MRRKRTLWVLLGGFLILFGLPLAFIAQQILQDNLDHRLIEAMDDLDAATFVQLLSNGANANARDTGEPPLTVSTLLRRLLDRLLHKPANVPHGERILIRVETLALSEQLYDNSNVAASNYDALAVALILHGANIDQRGKYGQTPLHISVLAHLHRTVSLMLSRGVPPDLRGPTGMTPLMGADARDAIMLLQHGADANARDIGNRTPLMYALERERFDVARILLQHRANVNSVDEFSRSALYRALSLAPSSDRIDMIRLLKHQGAQLTKNEKEALASE